MEELRRKLARGCRLLRGDFSPILRMVNGFLQLHLCAPILACVHDPRAPPTAPCGGPFVATLMPFTLTCAAKCPEQVKGKAIIALISFQFL